MTSRWRELPPLAHGPLVFGHMGDSSAAPENTLLSFALARSVHAALECDVRGSRDGDVFVIHDPTVDRTTDGAGEVHKMDRAALLALDAGHRFAGPAGTFPYRGRGVRIPTLAELLRQEPGALVNVDIHQAEPSIVAAVVRDIRATSARRLEHGGEVILTTQHTSTMREIEESEAPCALGLCRTQVLEVLARAAAHRFLEPLGLSRLLPVPERLRGRALQMPLNAWEEVQGLLPGALRPAMPLAGVLIGLALGPVSRGPRDFCLVTDAVIAYARRAAMAVHVWEVDDADVASACFARGIAGVISNTPGAVGERVRKES